MGFGGEELVDGEESVVEVGADEDNVRVETACMSSSEVEFDDASGRIGSISDEEELGSPSSTILMGTRLRFGATAVAREGADEVDGFGFDKSIGTRFCSHNYESKGCSTTLRVDCLTFPELVALYCSKASIFASSCLAASFAGSSCSDRL